MPKKCFFKGCGNTSSNSTETFFNFPKETDPRYPKWIELTKCDPEKKWKLICSKHFDSEKYMVFGSQRRKMLVNTAMPFAYVPEPEPADTYNFNINSDQDDIFISSKEQVGISEDYEEIPAILDNREPVTKMARIQPTKCTESFRFQDLGYNDTPEELESRTQKQPTVSFRFKNTGYHAAPEELDRRARNQSTQSFRIKNSGYDAPKELDRRMDEELSPNVTTFIFKGEEYVQMPKNEYMAEREEFLREIWKYKSILGRLRSTINSIDDI